ncbi:MAG: acetylxylan esterase [Victivallaceae bacterium]|nr:acetylxylan esterase [Victivallaceae bacterium]
MMRNWILCGAAALTLCSYRATAEVPELTELVPDAKGYELIYRLSPADFANKGYKVDRGEELSGKLNRIGYLVKLTGQDGKSRFVFASMAPFTQNSALTGVPSGGSPVFQQMVDDLEVVSNDPAIKTGKFAKGNLEFWPTNYGAFNSAKVPDASNSTFDFGDSPAPNGNYTSMQVHNFREKQTIFAFNAVHSGPNSDFGIGNNPKGNPDWTFARNAKDYKGAEIFVVGKFDDLKIVKVLPIEADKADLRGTTDKNPLSYKTGDDVTFTVKLDYTGVQPGKSYFIDWKRTGDDGKTLQGRVPYVMGQPLVLKDKFTQPGFIRIYARLLDKNGRQVMHLYQKQQRPIFFDGGAGADVDQLRTSPEPADFSLFWDRQKAKLAAVPVKYTMTKLPDRCANGVDVYAVRIDCAGSRPVTGYLQIPANAQPKSLPVEVGFHGYSANPNSYQKPPKGGPTHQIRFTINAHGYELGKDAAYAKAFFDATRSNGQGYAFDPKQNSDPETAYFNGMALRVMRALEFVKTLPQWHGKTLAVSGGSQGGLQSLWAAGLDQDVTQCNVSIPWCCDLAGATKQKRLRADWRIPYVPALDYYDAANHAKRIKCPVIISRAGLGDYVCPPSGITAMYNNLKCPKQIIYVQGSQHGYNPNNPERFEFSAK